jgi:hypothetical protein
MGRQLGSKMPRQPESESEELAYYKALHFLRESAAEEDMANDALIAIYRKQCELISAIRPFTTWEEIGKILGLPRKTIANRYRDYSNVPVREFVNDEPE